MQPRDNNRTDQSVVPMRAIDAVSAVSTTSVGNHRKESEMARKAHRKYQGSVDDLIEELVVYGDGGEGVSRSASLEAARVIQVLRNRCRELELSVYGEQQQLEVSDGVQDNHSVGE